MPCRMMGASSTIKVRITLIRLFSLSVPPIRGVRSLVRIIASRAGRYRWRSTNKQQFGTVTDPHSPGSPWSVPGTGFADKRDVYARVTAQIINTIEQGVGTWRACPGTPTGAMPSRRSTPRARNHIAAPIPCACGPQRKPNGTSVANWPPSSNGRIRAQATLCYGRKGEQREEPNMQHAILGGSGEHSWRRRRLRRKR
jgi:hypothetical protein